MGVRDSKIPWIIHYLDFAAVADRGTLAKILPKYDQFHLFLISSQGVGVFSQYSNTTDGAILEVYYWPPDKDGKDVGT